MNIKKKIRTKIKVCPHCKEGKNSKADGGNERCFHCGNRNCGFIECYWSVYDVEQALSSQRKELIEEIKEMKQYPDRPCPECGGKLKFGRSDNDGMTYGCYSKKCPAVKRHSYFNYTSRDGREDYHNRALDKVIDKLKKKEGD